MSRVCLAFFLPLSLSGCFAVFIPGSLIDSAADGISGARGDHCVSTSAVIGAEIRAPDGRILHVKSLSGTSYRCKDETRPIRAELV